MANSTEFYFLPYRATQERIALIKEAIRATEAVFNERFPAAPMIVRPLYYYDLQLGEPSNNLAYDGSNDLTFAANTLGYGFSDSVTVQFTVPVNKVYEFYGVTDYAPSPSLQALLPAIDTHSYKPLYIARELNLSEDHTVLFNAPFRAIPPNIPASLTFFASAAVTEPIDVLGFVAEQFSVAQE